MPRWTVAGPVSMFNLVAMGVANQNYRPGEKVGFEDGRRRWRAARGRAMGGAAGPAGLGAAEFGQLELKKTNLP